MKIKNGFTQAEKVNEIINKAQTFQQFVENMRGGEFEAEELAFLWYFRGASYQVGYRDARKELTEKITEALS
jgi:hypothetical protein